MNMTLRSAIAQKDPVDFILNERSQKQKATYCNVTIRSDQISRSVVSNSLQPHESQHARPPCPSPTPGVHSDSRYNPVNTNVSRVGKPKHRERKTVTA